MEQKLIVGKCLIENNLSVIGKERLRDILCCLTIKKVDGLIHHRLCSIRHWDLLGYEQTLWLLWPLRVSGFVFIKVEPRNEIRDLGVTYPPLQSSRMENISDMSRMSSHSVIKGVLMGFRKHGFNFDPKTKEKGKQKYSKHLFKILKLLIYRYYFLLS